MTSGSSAAIALLIISPSYSRAADRSAPARLAAAAERVSRRAVGASRRRGAVRLRAWEERATLGNTRSPQRCPPPP